MNRFNFLSDYQYEQVKITQLPDCRQGREPGPLLDLKLPERKATGAGETRRIGRTFSHSFVPRSRALPAFSSREQGGCRCQPVGN